MRWPRCTLPALLSSILAAACAAGGIEPRGLPDVTRVPLVTTRDDGVADSQVVPVLFEEQDAWLALDTGAPFTFLFRGAGEDELVEHAGTVRIAGEWWDLPGYGDDAINRSIFGQIRRYRPDFLLLVGDAVRDGREYDDWERYFFGPGRDLFLDTPFYLCPGNHEENADWMYRFLGYPEPKNYYAFDYGNAHFTDSNLSCATVGSQPHP